MRNYITISALLVGAIIANSFYLKIPLAGMVLGFIYLVYFGSTLGRIILPKFDRFWAMLFGPLFLLAAVSLLGGTTYYFYNLNNRAFFGLLLLLPTVIIFAQKKITPPESASQQNLEKVEIVLPTGSPANRLAWLALILDGVLFYYLFTSAATEAIRSPWLLISGNFFLLFALATTLLILFLQATRRTFFTLCTIFVHGLLMLSLALIIYKLGYGFDPFVHRAAEDYIARFGVITPKTPYYIGQYALVIFLHKLSLLPVGLLDKILLPLIEALWLPPLIFLVLRQGLQLEPAASRLAALLFFITPFSDLITTTPQNLANFYALSFFLFGTLLVVSDLISLWPVMIMALSTLITHPLIGLPILMAATLLILVHYSPKKGWLKIVKKLFIFFSIFLAIVILPTVFLLYSQLKTGVVPDLPALPTVISRLGDLPPLPRLRPDFSFEPSWTLLYYYDFFFKLLYLMVVAISVVTLPKRYRPFILSSLAIFIIFWINILLLKIGVSFPEVINYEQNQYPDRLAQFSFYLLSPLFLYSLSKLFQQFSSKHKLLAALGGATLLTASLYLSYPRVDPYAFSRTFNVSAADFQAVEKITELASKKDYVVLSNQILAAAALEKFGFKKYYETKSGPVFYYALPTGGLLYSYYQKMVYENPSRETALEVMNLTGASQVYLAVNDYWNSFKVVVPLAKKNADEWWPIDGGKVMIFRFSRSAP